MKTITLTKQQFTEMYMNTKLKDLAAELGVSVNIIVKHAKELNLSKPRGAAKVKLIIE